MAVEHFLQEFIKTISPDEKVGLAVVTTIAVAGIGILGLVASENNSKDNNPPETVPVRTPAQATLAEITRLPDFTLTPRPKLTETNTPSPSLTSKPSETPTLPVEACMGGAVGESEIFKNGVDKYAAVPIVNEGPALEFFGGEKGIVREIRQAVANAVMALKDRGVTSVSIPKLAEGAVAVNSMTIGIRNSADLGTGWAVRVHGFPTGGWTISVRGADGLERFFVPSGTDKVAGILSDPVAQNVDMFTLPAQGAFGEMRLVKVGNCRWTVAQVGIDGIVKAVMNPEGSYEDVKSLWKEASGKMLTETPIVSPIVVTKTPARKETPIETRVVSKEINGVPESIVKLMKARPDVIPAKFKTFEVNTNPGHFNINVLWGKVSTNSFNVLTKDGKTVGTAKAYRDAYFFDSEGDPTKIRVPVVVELTNGRIMMVGSAKDLPLVDSDWGKLKEDDPTSYRSIFESPEGAVGTCIIRLVNITKGTSNLDYITVDSAESYEDPYLNSWRSEVTKFLSNGKPSGGLDVLAITYADWGKWTFPVK